MGEEVGLEATEWHGGGAARHSSALGLRGRRGLAGLLLLLLDLVVVVALLDLVLVRLLFSGARPEAWRGRVRGLCVAERWRGAVDVLEILRRGSTLALASSKFFGVSSALTSS